MYKVYGDYNSGNCYKIKLMLNLLGIEYQWIAVEIRGRDRYGFSGEKSERQNPGAGTGRRHLSLGMRPNAILNFLADGSRYLPEASHACAA